MVADVRLARMFHPVSGRCLNVAIDHGAFGESSFLAGIEDMTAAIGTLAAAGPDAIQLAPGQAVVLQSIPGKARPALVLRVDIANVYGPAPPSHLFSVLLDRAALLAIQLDAACVVVNLLSIPRHPEVYEACIRNVSALRAQCDEYRMPLMIEPLAMRPGTDRGAYAVDGDLTRIRTLVRQAAELGADVIKADPTDNPEDYHEVVEVARVPLLVRGGARVDDEALLRRTEVYLAQGARGVVYGRNIVQHPRPGSITGALLAILHEGASADDALRLLSADG